MKRADFLFLPWVVVVAVLAIGMSSSIALRAQSSERQPSFEVASVKKNLSNDRRSFTAQPGGRLVVRNFALKDGLRNHRRR